MNNETIKLLENYDSKIKKLDLSGNHINDILDLSKFTCLEILDCCNNYIEQIINLPNSLLELYCDNNQIQLLDNLPPRLKILHCDSNKIQSLDNLPCVLEILKCRYNNEIKNLDYLPVSLKNLDCSFTLLKSLDFLPFTLKELNCIATEITHINIFFNNLELLICDDCVDNLDDFEILYPELNIETDLKRYFFFNTIL